MTRTYKFEAVKAICASACVTDSVLDESAPPTEKLVVVFALPALPVCWFAQTKGKAPFVVTNSTEAMVRAACVEAPLTA
jgi:hypothetical protein